MKKFKIAAHNFLYQCRKLRSTFFIFLSRKILKNEGGFDLYVTGKIKHLLIKKFNPKKAKTEIISEANKNVVPFLRENKYAPINVEVKPELLQKIQAKVNQYIEDDNYSSVRGSRQGNTKDVHYTRTMNDLLKNIPEIKEILTPELETILTDYFGTNVGITSVIFWRNYHIPNNSENKIFYSNDWHNDYIEPTDLKMFMNITDVTENHGPLHVISAPKTRVLFKNKIFKGRKKVNDIASIENKENFIKHTGKAGSTVLAHASYCLHRADVPAEGNYRDMLQFQFHPASKPMEADWDKKSLPHP